MDVAPADIASSIITKPGAIEAAVQNTVLIYRFTGGFPNSIQKMVELYEPRKHIGVKLPPFARQF